MDLFCAGGALVSKNPAQAFQLTLKAAQGGYVPAQEVVGMMYAIGKGVQQDYREAGKWFLTAAEAGNTARRRQLRRLAAQRHGKPPHRPRTIRALEQVPDGAPGILSRSRPIKK